MTTDRTSERDRLAAVAADSWYASGVNGTTVRHCAAVLARHWRGRRCLELGPAEGIMTDALAERFPRLVCVDGSELFCANLSRRLPAVDVRCALFEEFEPDERFDTIVMSHVLEHVEDPVGLLKRARDWLDDGGIICAVVPNALSLHRQAAVLLGMLDSERTLNEADHHHGHRRVYDPECFRAEFEHAGLEIQATGGYWLKPLSNAQLERDWSPRLIDAFMLLGERLPDVAAEIFVVAGRRAGSAG